MALSTSTLRRMYSPACTSKADMYLNAYAAIDACLRAHNYWLRKEDTGAYNCRKITGGSGWSLHAYGPGTSYRFWNGVTIATSLAVDFNWQTNPYGPRLITDMPRAMVNDILAIRTNSGAQVWGWGGYYSGNKDAMHYEIVCSPDDLRSGIDPRTVPGSAPQEEVFDLSTEQYNNIMDKLNELDFEQTKQHGRVIEVLGSITTLVAKLSTDVKDREYAVRDTMISAFRRIMGVRQIEDNAKQQQLDRDTGSKVQGLLNRTTFPDDSPDN